LSGIFFQDVFANQFNDLKQMFGVINPLNINLTPSSSYQAPSPGSDSPASSYGVPLAGVVPISPSYGVPGTGGGSLPSYGVPGTGGGSLPSYGSPD
jgi:hypothetical protein